MDKFRYGTKEIIATVSLVTVFVLLRQLETYLLGASVIQRSIFTWVQPGMLVVAIAAVFFGPVSGFLCGLTGGFLTYIMLEPAISYPRIVATGLYGFFIGLYFGKMHYKPDDFTPRGFIDFNAVQIMTSIFIGLVFLPLVRFMVEEVSIYDELLSSAKSLVGNTVLIGITCPVIMIIVSAVLSADSEKKRRRT